MMTTAPASRVKCGNRAYHGADVVYHASPADVRECFANSGRFGKPVAPVAPAPVVRPAEVISVETAVDRMRASVEAKEAAEAAAKRARYAAWRSIPVYTGGRAYYALVRNGVTQFYKIERPSEGPHQGKTFVTRQASDSFDRMPWVESGEVMDAIAADAEAAGLRYGREIGRCYRCHRTLTDAESRAAGIGPDCAKKG